MRPPTAVVLSVAFVLSLIFAGTSQAAEGPLPALHFVALDGSSHSLAELQGHGAVVNFWATWCTPCREEMHRLQKLSEVYAAKGVTFVSISLDEADTKAKIPDLLRRSNFKIPVWQGATADTLKRLDLGVLVPATLILDDQGTVIGRIEGEARDKDIQSRLDWLLGGRNGKQPKIVQKNDW